MTALEWLAGAVQVCVGILLAVIVLEAADWLRRRRGGAQ